LAKTAKAEKEKGALDK